jgi:hypothetical protein
MGGNESYRATVTICIGCIGTTVHHLGSFKCRIFKVLKSTPIMQRYTGQCILTGQAICTICLSTDAMCVPPHRTVMQAHCPAI